MEIFSIYQGIMCPSLGLLHTQTPQAPNGLPTAARAPCLATLTGWAKIQKITRISFCARPKPAQVWGACWTTGPITILNIHNHD
jgi:hypothetical protein